MTRDLPDGKKILSQYAKKCSTFLDDFFEQKKIEMSVSATPESALMLSQLQEFCTRGGKRLRPALVYYGYLLKGGQDSPEIVQASLSVELVHAFLLIHDDIMDESETRRGKKTVHTVYTDEALRITKKKRGAVRFGESMGILLGDLAFALGNELITESDFGPVCKLHALNVLNTSVASTIAGQELDIRMPLTGECTLEQVLSMYELKTACYTFELPLHLGMVLAGGDEKDLNRMTQLALPLGIAFQVQDDMLGVFGDEEETGKPTGSDIQQGKSTLLVAKALENGSVRDVRRVKELVGKKDLTKKELNEVRDLFIHTGAQAYAQEYLDLQRQKLQEVVPQLRAYYAITETSKEAADAIEAIAKYVLVRKK